MDTRRFPDIVLLSVDDLRFDALSAETNRVYLTRYQLERVPSTPHLDSVAASGARFAQAIATAPYTPASHTSMLTGLFPPSHGVRAFLKDRLLPEVPTLGERLRALGYVTIGALDFAELFQLVGLTRGLDHIVKANDDALSQLLARHRGRPRFLFMHLTDVHPPVGESPCPPTPDYHETLYHEKRYLAELFGFPPGAVERRPVERVELVALSNAIRRAAEARGIWDVIQFPRYLNGVNRFDRGRFHVLTERLRAAGMFERALVIVTADHGQGPIPRDWMAALDAPKKFDHGEALLEEIVRVPLLMAGPGIPPGRVVSEQVSLVDIVPTVLESLGVRCEAEGRSLLPLIRGEARGDSTAYSEVWYHDRAELSRHLRQSVTTGKIIPAGYETFLYQKAVRTPRYKLIEIGEPFTDADLELPDDQFLTQAFRKVLGKAEGGAWYAELRTALAERRLTRADVLESLRARSGGREWLFDLRADPFEQVNLLPLTAARDLGILPEDFSEVAARLRRVLEGVLARGRGAHEELDQSGVEIDAITARLRDLGYLE